MAAAILIMMLLWAVAEALLLWRGPNASGAWMRDSDDYMRVVQVIDWLDGQGWYNLVQHRMSLPTGLPMHWSRLADLPVAAAIVVLQPLIGRASAVDMATLIVPGAMIGVLGLSWLWAARPLTGNRSLALGVLALPSLMIALAQFTPGRVDHHSYQAVGAVLLLGGVARAAVGRPLGRGALVAGIATALNMWVSVEAIAYLGLAVAALVGAWVITGGPRPRVALPLLLVTLLAILILMPIGLRPSAWFQATCDGFSDYAVALVLGLTVIVALMARLDVLAGRPGSMRVTAMALRLGIAVISTLPSLVALWFLFPACRGGPEAVMVPAIRPWFDSVAEVQPLWRSGLDQQALTAATPLLAAIGCLLYALITRSRRQRRTALAMAALTAGGLAMVMIHVRLALVAAPYGSLGLAFIGVRLCRWAGRLSFSPARLLMTALVLWVMATAPAVGILAVKPWADTAAAKAAEAAVNAPDPCYLKSEASVLDDLSDEAHPLTIAAPIDLGPQILFYTHHIALTGPYHRDVRGISDTMKLFAATDDTVARQILADHNATILLACVSGSQAGGIKALSQEEVPHSDRERPEASTLQDRLMAGKIPSWLRPIALPTNAVQAFRVVPQNAPSTPLPLNGHSD